MSIPTCPRCGCCSVMTLAGGLMRCYGDCDVDGIHLPETAEEVRAAIAEKDAEITRLRAAVPTCPECGEPIAISWTADDPPISFTMHRCEGVQK